MRPKLPQTIGGSAPQVPISAHHSQWPREVSGLCDRAQALVTELNGLKPDYAGLQSLQHPQYPKVSVSKATVESAARLFHALLFAIEATGIPFRKSRSKYEGGYFETNGERIQVEISEITKPDHLAPSWQSKKVGTGKLMVSLEAGGYDRRWKKSWSQDKDGGVREIVAAITPAVTEYYAERAKQRAEEAERRRLEHERWVQQQEAQKKQQHEQALLDSSQQRLTDFLYAVEWSDLHRKALAFLAECESKWKTGTPLTPEQETWLQWARDAANAWSPWQTGYPDPAKDGAFDSASVPFGGPYPPTRNFPRPPTMPKLKLPQSTDTWPSHHAPQKDQYPFWLRHR